jgi:hypothetical protein
MLTAVFRLVGHVSGGPRGVADQSCSRIRAPIAPPPARNAIEKEALLSIALSHGRSVARPLLLVQGPQGSAYDLAGAAVMAVYTLSVDHAGRFVCEEDAADELGEHEVIQEGLKNSESYMAALSPSKRGHKLEDSAAAKNLGKLP